MTHAIRILPHSFQPDIDWRLQGDSFLDSMPRTLSESGHCDGMNFQISRRLMKFNDALYGEVEDIQFTNLQWPSSLISIKESGGARSLAILLSAGCDEDLEVTNWCQVILRSLKRMQEGVESKWFAIIGARWDLACASCFPYNGKIGDFTVRSVDQRYVALDSGALTMDAGGGRVHFYYPVVIEGKCKESDSRSLLRIARREVAWISGVLTLCTDAEWVLLRQPHVGEHFEYEIPAVSPGIPVELGQLSNTVRQVHLYADPDLLFRAMRTNVKLSNRVKAFSHARSLEKTSPSLASILYVSLIESLGKNLAKRDRCDCCPECTIPVGCSQQFSAALRLGARSEQEFNLLSNMYSKRSRTVHDGLLHGWESSPDLNTPNFWADASDPENFQFQYCLPLMEVARRLLLNSVAGALPNPLSEIVE